MKKRMTSLLLALAGQMDGVDVIWIFPDGELRYTPGLADCIIKE